MSYQLRQDWPKKHLTEDLEKIFEAADIEIERLRQGVFHFTDLIDPEILPSELLDAYLLGKGFRLAVDFPNIVFSEREKRKLATLAVPIFSQKGTAAGIINIIRLLLGLEAAVIVQTNVDVWVLDEKELDTETILAPDGTQASDRRYIYGFEIVLEEPATPDQEEKIIALANFMKPIHTHLLGIIEPQPLDHVELGLSLLDDEFDLH